MESSFPRKHKGKEFDLFNSREECFKKVNLYGKPVMTFFKYQV